MFAESWGSEERNERWFTLFKRNKFQWHLLYSQDSRRKSHTPTRSLEFSTCFWKNRGVDGKFNYIIIGKWKLYQRELLIYNSKENKQKVKKEATEVKTQRRQIKETHS